MRLARLPLSLVAISSILVISINAEPKSDDNSPRSRYLNAPISFEANRGQADPQVSFVSHGGGYSLLLSPQQVILRMEAKSKSHDSARSLRTTFIGANPDASLTGEQRLPGTSNYLIGADRSRWLTNVPNFARVQYSALYSGIDLVYYGNQNHLEYDFQVSPHANADKIRFAISGGKPKLGANGDLILDGKDGGVAWHKPVAYQVIAGERREIQCSYSVSGNNVQFTLAAYDHNMPLTIDPPLVWGSFLGGTSTETIAGLQVDAAGELIVTGQTSSTDFPTTANAHGRHLQGSQNVFVTKFSADGRSLIYSTYVGGPSGAYPNGLAVDSQGDAYVSGSSGTDFPFTPGSYKSPLFNGFLFKLDASGTTLIYSMQALANGGVAVDSSGDAYVAGGWPVGRATYPFTPGAYHNQLVNGKYYVSVAGDVNSIV